MDDQNEAGGFEEEVLGAQDQEELEGGEVDGSGIAAVTGHEGAKTEDPRVKRERAKTANTMALLLLWFLFLTFVGHYFAVSIRLASGDRESAEVLNELFSRWLPVISGFVGTGMTYYFTKDK